MSKSTLSSLLSFFNGKHDRESRVDDLRKASIAFPDLITLYEELSPYGESAQNNFVRIILDEKRFETAKEVRDLVVRSDLQQRFGSRHELQSFGQSLIISGNSEAALALQEYVRVLGDHGSSDKIIDSVRQMLKSPIYDKMEALYLVGENYVARLKGGAAIAFLDGKYQRFGSFYNYSKASNSFSVEHNIISDLDEAACEFLDHIPRELIK